MRSVIHKAAWPLSPVFGETAVVSAVWTSKSAVATPFAVHFYEYLFLAGKADHGWSEGYYLNNLIIVRHYPLEENINYCFVGIRRTGKSYMMYQQNAQQRNCFYTGWPFCHHEYISLFLLWVSDCKWKRKELSGYYQHKW